MERQSLAARQLILSGGLFLQEFAGGSSDPFRNCQAFRITRDWQTGCNLLANA
jgi:hypothetical protein